MNPKHTQIQQRGFTLTELMITVAIIAILATFLAPSVSTYMHRNKGRSAANAVASTLRVARNHAMSNGQVVFADIDATGDHGAVKLYRNQDPDCNVPNPAPSCFTQSCAQASQLPDAHDIETPRSDLAGQHPDMMISGYNIDGDTFTDDKITTLCFAPDGRVLSKGGLPFSSACDGINARIFVQAIEPGTQTNPLGSGAALNKCLTNTNSSEQAAKQTQKNGRDIANFFVIQIPYNGAISVIQ